MRSRFHTLTLGLALLSANSLWALPTLQLDIVGGVFDWTTQTTVATSDSFTVRALLCGNYNPGTYYISAAITPGMAQSNPVPDFGTVVINGQTYQPSQYYYGTPPVDVLDTNAGNLAGHSVFPTYYLEFAFTFNSSDTVAAYNVQDDAAAPGTLYYKDFTVNVAGLLDAYTLHFDLYNEVFKNGDLKVGKFAPFSHDAESGHIPEVPDSGASQTLLGLGLVLLVAARRKIGGN